MADVPIDCEFPVWGLLPKKETGVVSFLNKYPEYDGRGTVIAILDSGVDPAAEGLKLTSTNETKVIERFDCSGAGDVDTSTVIKSVGADGCITGITGRKLKIPETWKNPTGVWRVGILYPFSLYPVKLKERVQEHRREHLWNSGHKPALVEVNKLLQDFERDIGSKSTTLSYEDKLLKEELETRLEILTTADKKYTDLGPSYDCVLFHDGEVWRACIDTSESGELSSGPLLGEYGATHEHAHLTPLDEMTVSVNVHDDGAVLEVVGMCSTHGTHVAAIAAGCFPDEPDRNGVAPGARVVSLTIGDSRLGSMETGAALVRACIKLMELSKAMDIDVVNMSYGEHAHWSNAGRIGDVICEVVNRYGVSWVVSGGNHGPALCTVGAPPDIAQPILIGVAAYVSPEMMSATYSMRARLAGGAFSWSSRGPAADGGQGLSVAAPGGAVTSVARFTLKNSQLMNGTSMAAPHVAGAVALLVSGLKALQLPHSPYFMKRSLENSATYLEHVEPWAQGCGLLNVEKAFELLSTYSDRAERDVTFSVAAGAEGAKGVLLRPAPDEPPRELSVTVEPRFLQSHRDMEDKGVIPRQISFGVRLALTCGAAWVSLPAHLDLRNAARALALRIDHGALPPGAHHTSINAYDVSCVAQGPLFRVPVTVVRALPAPRAAPALHEVDALFKPAAIKRHFIFVPEDATWGVLRLSSREASAGRFLVHVMQLLPRRSCRSHETLKMLTVAPDAPALLPFQLVGGVMVEVTIAKYWASLGEQTITYTLELGGLRPDCGPRLTLSAAGGLRAVTLRSLRPHDVQPVAQLKHAEPVYRPSETKISPLSSRDVIPPNRQIYQLINTYNFHLAKGTEVSPIVSLLCDMLYESEFESQMWMLYNSAKQLMAVGDAYPLKYSVKLEKGEYVLRLNVRHESRALLERLQELPVVLQQRLPQPIQLDAYAAQSNALSGGKKLGTCSTVGGALTPIYFGPVPADKIGRSALTVGQTLTGQVTFAKEELPRRVDAYELHYVVCEPPRRPGSGGSGASGGKDKPKPGEEYADAYRDFAAGWLAKLEGDKLEQVYAELAAQFPAWAGAHVAYLNSLDPPTDHKKLPNPDAAPDVSAAWCEQIIAIADKAIKLIDQEKLLAYLGMKNDSRPDAAKIKQENEKQRGYLVDALCRRGVALCRLRALAGDGAAGAGAGAGAGGAQPLHDNMLDLLKFTDITADAKVMQYGVWHAAALRQWGRALRLLQRLQEERGSRDADARAALFARRLRWPHLARHTERAAPARFPHAYRPF